MKNLYLVTEDIRFKDNETLYKAANESDSLDIVYIFDKNKSSFRLNFICQALDEFNLKLKKLDQKLFIITDVKEIHEDYDQIYTAKTYNLRDKIKGFKKLIEVDTRTLYKEVELSFNINDLQKTFTDFRKTVETKSPECKEFTVKELPPHSSPQIKSFETFRSELKLGKKNSNFNGGESYALDRLKYYFFESESVKDYKETRNGMIKFDDSTKFSPWLSIGSISPKTIYRELKRYEQEYTQNKSTYWVYFELLWRDFFKFLAKKSKEDFFKQSGIQKKDLDLAQDQESKLKKWINYSTQDNFVDANMKEISTTGWMSNRGRQNVASYLAKDLKVSWIDGAKYFEKTLIDYDTESNWGNWAYLSGVGVDPRDRKFNTKKQAKDYDPDMEYRKKFLPERYK